MQHEKKVALLGKLCRNNHNWNQTGQSLRRASDSECLECRKEQKERSAKAKKEQRLSSVTNTYIGTLCIKKHNWNETGGSRRYIYNNTCTQCNKEKNKSRESGKGNKKEQARRHYQKHKLILNHKREALRSKHFALVHKSKFSQKELKAHFNQIKGCAYCGEQKSVTIDHFIPISKGGTDTLTNLLPACWECNLSKRDTDPLEWYKQQPFYSDSRWQIILTALSKRKAHYRQLTLF
jgi:5-methylcytosine-specific restriction endonuclease McrA